VTEPCAIKLKVREDQNVVIAICHHFELCVFEMRSKFHCGFCCNLNQHQLVDEVLTKFTRLVSSGAIFMKYPIVVRQSVPKLSDLIKMHACLSQARKVVVFTAELDVAKASVAEHMASDAYILLVLCVDLSCRHSEKFLKVRFSSW